MLDSEKIDLIDLMLQDFWQCSTVNEDGVVCLLNAIASVVNFKRKDEGNAEN